jgi:hypothetical protein
MDWVTGVRSPAEAENFSSTCMSSQLWDTPSLPQWAPGTFPGGKCGWCMLLTTHPLAVPRLRKRGAVPPLAMCHVGMIQDTFTFTSFDKLYDKELIFYVSEIFPTSTIVVDML